MTNTPSPTQNVGQKRSRTPPKNSGGFVDLTDDEPLGKKPNATSPLAGKFFTFTVGYTNLYTHMHFYGKFFDVSLLKNFAANPKKSPKINSLIKAIFGKN